MRASQNDFAAKIGAGKRNIVRVRGSSAHVRALFPLIGIREREREKHRATPPETRGRLHQLVRHIAARQR